MEFFRNALGAVKYILLAGLLFFIGGILGSGDISSASLDQVSKSVTSSLEMGSLSQADNRMVKRLYGINANDFEGVSLYVSDSNMKVEEILIVRLRDPDQSSLVEAAVDNRLDRQLESFRGYGPEQCRLLEDSVLDVKGNYVLFVVHKDAAAADAAFLKSL